MTKPKLISISGSIHAGKTTVSRILAKDLWDAAYLDGDMINSLVKLRNPELEILDKRLPKAHGMIAEIIKASLADGRDVIVDYPLSDKTRSEILNDLEGIDVDAYWFLLQPDINKVLAGSKTRPDLSEWELSRIKYHYDGDIGWTEMAVVIDSTNQTPEETADAIIKYIGGNDENKV